MPEGIKPLEKRFKSLYRSPQIPDRNQLKRLSLMVVINKAKGMLAMVNLCLQ